MTRQAAVFLDRDGVLTVPVAIGSSERPPWTIDELVFVDGAAQALGRLRAAGYSLVAVTNQPDVARGDAKLDDIEEINAATARELGLDAIYMCPHDGRACSCRKPRPGMVLAAARDLELDLSGSWMIGDRWVDIAAGLRAGVRTILLDRPGSWAPSSAGSPPTDLAPDAIARDLAGAVDVIAGIAPS